MLERFGEAEMQEVDLPNVVIVSGRRPIVKQLCETVDTLVLVCKTAVQVHRWE